MHFGENIHCAPPLRTATAVLVLAPGIEKCTTLIAISATRITHPVSKVAAQTPIETLDWTALLRTYSILKALLKKDLPSGHFLMYRNLLTVFVDCLLSAQRLTCGRGLVSKDF